MYAQYIFKPWLALITGTAKLNTPPALSGPLAGRVLSIRH
jgi:hypothetical protein